jgi:hypothetical protein
MAFEFYYRKISEELSRAIIAFKRKYPETKNNYYPQELTNIFEKYIEVHGNAYCMDVGSERKKISKLLYRMLNELKN